MSLTLRWLTLRREHDEPQCVRQFGLTERELLFGLRNRHAKRLTESTELAEVSITNWRCILQWNDEFWPNLTDDFRRLFRANDVAAAGGDKKDVTVLERFCLLTIERMTEVPEVTDLHALDLEQEDRVVASISALIRVVIGANPGNEDLMHLVFAGTAHDLEVRFDRRQIRMSGVLMRDGDDVGRLFGHCVPGDLVDRVRQDNGLFRLDTNAVVTEKAEFRHK